MPRKVLGKGLEALIPQTVMDSIGGERVVRIPIDQIASNPRQPRERFDDAKLKSLSESIRRDGILQPVVVRKKDQSYELVLGERRLKAARLAGIPSIPAIVKKVEDVDSLRLALVENLQREDLGPVEVARAYRAMIDTFGLTQEELADLVARDRSSVTNALRLLKLPPEVLSLLDRGDFSEGHARALLALPTRAEQIALAKRIIENKLTVRQVETAAGAGRKKHATVEKKPEKPAQIVFLEKSFGRHLSTRVSIDERRGGKGRIVIEFYSHEDFERLAELMHIPLPR